MSHPLIDYEIGKMTRREYEARACGCWQRMRPKRNGKQKQGGGLIHRKLSKLKNAFKPNGLE